MTLYFDRAHFGWQFSFASMRLHRIKRSFSSSHPTHSYLLIVKFSSSWRMMCWFHRFIAVIETWTKSFRLTNSSLRISSRIICDLSFFFLIWHSIHCRWIQWKKCELFVDILSSANYCTIVFLSLQSILNQLLFTNYLICIDLICDCNWIYTAVIHGLWIMLFACWRLK